MRNVLIPASIASAGALLNAKLNINSRKIDKDNDNKTKKELKDGENIITNAVNHHKLTDFAVLNKPEKDYKFFFKPYLFKNQVIRQKGMNRKEYKKFREKIYNENIKKYVGEVDVDRRDSTASLHEIGHALDYKRKSLKRRQLEALISGDNKFHKRATRTGLVTVSSSILGDKAKTKKRKILSYLPIVMDATAKSIDLKKEYNASKFAINELKRQNKLTPKDKKQLRDYFGTYLGSHITETATQIAVKNSMQNSNKKAAK